MIGSLLKLLLFSPELVRDAIDVVHEAKKTRDPRAAMRAAQAHVLAQSLEYGYPAPAPQNRSGN